jgi:hypothetical protein
MIELKDILINARQESHRMRHYYLGIEHLFIALLEIKSGLTSSILAEDGLSSEYVIDAIRRKTGKGSKHRLWAGIQNTPRTDVVLGIAQEIAKEQNRSNITERDLLVAILEESDSLPLRVLISMSINMENFHQQAMTRKIAQNVTQSFVTIEFSPNFGQELNGEEVFILRRMFHGYSKIRVESRLTGGYTSATLLVVTPINDDNREDAPVVVKIGETDSIQDEAQRYERYVKNTLPPMTARLEDRPTAPEASDLAGLKYTLLTDDEGNPRNMRMVAREWQGEKLGEWLRSRLYSTFGANWWLQNRPYRFEAWQEYDWVMPPILTLELLKTETAPEDAQVIKFPVRRNRFNHLEYGETVVIENFVVYRVNKEQRSITLALGQGNNTRALQIEVRGIDFEEDTYYRGEIVERIIGRIWKTRQEQLTNAIRELTPDFDFRENTLRAQAIKLPSPLHHYSKLLDMTLMGTMSTVHGDLHLGNIVIGQNESPLLIDFAHARDGHTVFDWATLEISLINELFAQFLTKEWDSVRDLVPVFQRLNHPYQIDTENPDIRNATQPLRALRRIVAECLASNEKWEEYWVALAMIALRAVTWNTLSLPQRRLMFFVSALAITELEQSSYRGEYSTDATEFTKNTGIN